MSAHEPEHPERPLDRSASAGQARLRPDGERGAAAAEAAAGGEKEAAAGQGGTQGGGQELAFGTLLIHAAAFVVLVAGIKFADTILAPLVAAVFLAVVLLPAQVLIRRSLGRIHESLSRLALPVLLLGILAGGFFLVWGGSRTVADFLHRPEVREIPTRIEAWVVDTLGRLLPSERGRARTGSDGGTPQDPDRPVAIALAESLLESPGSTDPPALEWRLDRPVGGFIQRNVFYHEMIDRASEAERERLQAYVEAGLPIEDYRAYARMRDHIERLNKELAALLVRERMQPDQSDDEALIDARLRQLAAAVAERDRLQRLARLSREERDEEERERRALARLDAEVGGLRGARAQRVATFLKDSYRDLLSAAQTTVEVTGNTLAQALLVSLLVIFFLLEADALPRRVEPRIRERWLEAVEQVRVYLRIKTICSIVTGGACFAMLFWLGVPYAFALGLLTFLLNYIPNIGSVLAGGLACAIALLFGTPATAIGVLATYLVVNMVVGNWLEPWWVSKETSGASADGTPVSDILIMMVFWGWVLGLIGVLFSVPITLIAWKAFGSRDQPFSLMALYQRVAAGVSRPHA